MVKVYFQSYVGSHSELVATFTSEKMYIQCLPILEAEAEKQSCYITESIEEND
jgi:hypothetical protein